MSRSIVDSLLQASKVHESWYPLLADCLSVVDSDYLQSLWADDTWLPGKENMLAAFRQDLHQLKWILFGESPYPRPQSSVGIAFLDGAVENLWSDSGLSTAVNRATSLRNLIKCMLVADGRLEAHAVSQQRIAELDKSALVNTIDELFDNLASEGFLLLNVTPVLHPQRKPTAESRYWHDFNRCLLEGIANYFDGNLPILVLWGKIAKTIRSYDAIHAFRVIESEHPYNVSFISNSDALALFAEVSPLHRRGTG